MEKLVKLKKLVKQKKQLNLKNWLNGKIGSMENLVIQKK